MCKSAPLLVGLFDVLVHSNVICTYTSCTQLCTVYHHDLLMLSTCVSICAILLAFHWHNSSYNLIESFCACTHAQLQVLPLELALSLVD